MRIKSTELFDDRLIIQDLFYTCLTAQEVSSLLSLFDVNFHHWTAYGAGGNSSLNALWSVTFAIEPFRWPELRSLLPSENLESYRPHLPPEIQKLLPPPQSKSWDELTAFNPEVGF